MDDGGETRMLVECTECGTVYAAREKADGAVFPIGNPQGCYCGSTSFVKLQKDEVFDLDDVDSE